MNCSVNLVPAQRLCARQRLRHRNRWCFIGVACVALVAAGWAVQHAANRSLERLARHVHTMQGKRSDIQRDLAVADARREQLLTRLETASQARCPQVWPRRLVDLTKETPEALFLTELTIQSEGAGQANRRNIPLIQNKASDNRAAEAKVQSVRMQGYALDHGALLQFVNALQLSPGWQQVELVRATQGPFRGGNAIVFELDCRTVEVTQ